MSTTLPALPLRLKTGLALLLAVIMLLFALPPAAFAQESGQAAEATAQGYAGAPSTIIYIVKRGDTLNAIARRYNTTVEAILKVNPQIRNPDRIWPGQRIRIPVAPDRPADFTRTRIYLIALDDGGASGRPIGCNDSLVPVTVDIPATRAILRGSLEKLLSLRDAYYGESGLYNALYQSQLTIQDVRIENRVAIISLSGQLVVGGVCDAPRVQAQLEQIALQFSTVDRVLVYINGRLLADVLSSR